MVFRRRPKHILAMYIESKRVEVLLAHRRWRSWHIGTLERFSIPDGEAPWDYLQRLNYRPKNSQATAFVLFLPRTYYSFHKEPYPAALGDQLEQTLNFDWQENVFYDAEDMLHFAGPPVEGDEQLIVPIFSITRELHEKFAQALGASNYASYNVIPTALAFKAFIGAGNGADQQSRSDIFARLHGPDHMEVHRFVEGRLIESVLVHEKLETLRLFREALQSMQEGEDGREIKVQLLCDAEEMRSDAPPSWVSEVLPSQNCTLDRSMLSSWLEQLVTEERIYAFGPELHLKPWHPPKVLLPLLIVVGLYAIFASYQLYHHKQLLRTSSGLQSQIKQLEAQWKPIEQLQSNIARLQEDQKALAEFDRQGYPVLALLTHLSQITPEDTYLDFLSLSNNQLQIRGESKSAVKYLSDLSKVEGFSNVSFASPVSRNPRSDKERFNVRVQLDVEKLRTSLAGKVVDHGAELGSGEGLEPHEEGATSQEPTTFDAGNNGSAPSSVDAPLPEMPDLEPESEPLPIPEEQPAENFQEQEQNPVVTQEAPR